MANGPHMNGAAPGPPMSELDRLVPGMEAPGLGLHPGPPGPPNRGPPVGNPGVGLPDDLTGSLNGSEDLNSGSMNRQQARLLKGQVHLLPTFAVLCWVAIEQQRLCRACMGANACSGTAEVLS